MSGLLLLSLRHALHQRAATLTLIVCIAIAMFLPVTASILMERYERDLHARAAATPLLMGARGQRFDLTLAALYFRRSEHLATLPYPELERLRSQGAGSAVPLHVRFTAGGKSLVATTDDYYRLRGLRVASGVLPVHANEALIGSRAAAALNMQLGDQLLSDPEDLYDISKPAALRLRIVGVLAEHGTPDDDAIFISMDTAWILEGLAHQHAGELDGAHGALLPADAHHYHGDPELLPLSAILFFPADEKAGTLLRSRVNRSRVLQMLAPSEVLTELVSFVLRIKTLFDRATFVLFCCTGLLSALVLSLGAKLRAREMRTLARIGCDPSTVFLLQAIEFLLILLSAAALAGLGVAAVLGGWPNLASLAAPV